MPEVTGLGDNPSAVLCRGHEVSRWRWADGGANLAKRNLTQLTALVKTRLKKMQYRPGLLDGFLASTGLDFTPFL